MRSQARDRHRPAFESVSRPMQAIGNDFFERHGNKYLILMDHFSGMVMYEMMGHSNGHGAHGHAAQDVVCHFQRE